MFEIFFFINPVGIYCYDTEKLIRSTITELDIDACYHFIPIVTINVIKKDILQRKKDGQKIIDINNYTMAAYNALKDYHAIKLAYGNKKARSYVFNLQRKINKNFNVYSSDLPRKVAKELNLNVKNIEQIKNSNYVIDSIDQDKKLAKKSKIKSIPTTVVFNENDNYSGVLFEGTATRHGLIKLFAPKQDNYALGNFFKPKNHLRLI